MVVEVRTTLGLQMTTKLTSSFSIYCKNSFPLINKALDSRVTTSECPFFLQGKKSVIDAILLKVMCFSFHHAQLLCQISMAFPTKHGIHPHASHRTRPCLCSCRSTILSHTIHSPIIGALSATMTPYKVLGALSFSASIFPPLLWTLDCPCRHYISPPFNTYLGLCKQS